MATDNLDSKWANALTLIASTLGPATMGQLHRARPLATIEGTILVAVPDAFVQSRIESHALPSLIDALSQLYGRDINIHFTVDPQSIPEPTPIPDPVEPAPHPAPSIVQPSVPPAPTSPSAAPSHTVELTADDRVRTTAAEPVSDQLLTIDRNTTNLNPKYTFDTYVMGPSNRFAHATAFQVAEDPGQGFYNPLFIYGDSGLGKTHLLHAIGNYALTLYPHLKVRYVNSEEFTNDFINSIRDHRIEEFQRRYRQVDILLIDDIQFLDGKEQTMEEFFHTFNSLYNLNKQIVLTSDLPPAKLQGIEDRLRSRFAMGLTADIQAPDLETRIAILRKKAHAESLEVSPSVLEYIASRISSNVRELEGALLRVTAYAQITQQEADVALAEVVLKNVISEPGDAEITANLIMAQTAAYFGFTVEQLASAERSRPLVEARQSAMYLCRELTNLSLPQIGEAFGGRDHSTVLHAHKKIASLLSSKKETYNNLMELTSRVKQAARNA